MYTQQQRAELASLMYMTVNNEIAKPMDEINTELVDKCMELADMLIGRQPITDSESEAMIAKIMAMAEHRRKRKRIKVRIIAAVIAAALILGSTISAFSDELAKIFGIETIQTMQPGDKVTMEQHELDVPSDIIYFDTIDELLEYLEQPIYLPSKLEGFELKEVRIESYDFRTIDITWVGDGTINCMINIAPYYFNEYLFEKHDYEYYSKEGYPFNFKHLGTCWQATTWINATEYIILASNTDLLKQFIDAMEITE